MPYLVDANCFIQAKNSFYGFDFCPGFWDWIDQQHALKTLFSIDKIALELAKGNDDLAAWAKQKGGDFFLPMDTATGQKNRIITTWVQQAGFRQHVIDEFFRGADPFLIAYAFAHNYTVVTHEIKVNANQMNKVKIPNVCAEFNIQHVTIFDLLRSTGAKLHI